MRKIRFYMIFIPLLFSSLSLPQQAFAEFNVERVIIISIDSMNNNFIFNEYENPDFVLTPNIGYLVENGAAFNDAEAVMPTKTQVNHVTMVSGCYAEKIGFAGNYVLDIEKSSIIFWRNYIYPWKNPELIKADTIFEALEREDASYTSAVIGGKNFVGCPIWADIQVGPAWVSKTAKDLGVKKFPEVQLWDAPDEWVMDNVLLIMDEVDPDIMLVNLAFLDPVQHAFGQGSMEAWATLSWADYQVGRLLRYLMESGKLGSTLIVVTADHGQSNQWESIALGKMLRKEGIKTRVVADGPFAHIFLLDENDLEEAVNFLGDLEAVDGIWYGESLDDIHIRTPYTGDIVISLQPPYEAFSYVKSPTIGTHGGLQQRYVPLVFFGPNVKRGLIMETASLTDIVPTICEITNWPLPRDSQGEVLPVIDRTQTTAPDVSIKLRTYKSYIVSYISLLFFILSILTLVPAIVLHTHDGRIWLEVSSKKISNIVPYLLVTISVVFALISSFYSYVVNLYAVPGIQPDSFLVSMDFGILGSFIVSMSLSLTIIWYLPLGIQILLQKIRRKGWVIITAPLSLIIFTFIQLIYTSFNMVIRIPYNYAFHIFVVFFFGGFGISYIIRMWMFKKLEVVSRKIFLWTIILGILNVTLWFYLVMFMLFPNYLFEFGIKSIL